MFLKKSIFKKILNLFKRLGCLILGHIILTQVYNEEVHGVVSPVEIAKRCVRCDKLIYHWAYGRIILDRKKK
ncbi:MAG: hypothetical protein M0Q88_00035 [Bacilli bacterium]|nr:hypothetical protein [Bacilli bacterium]